MPDARPSSEPFPWCRRLFASVDLAGSTNFKQRHPNNSGAWARLFQQFFDEFPSKLEAAYTKGPRPTDGVPNKKLRVWKYVGDEILFDVVLSDHNEAVHHVMAFRDAIIGYSEEFRGGKPDLRTLGFKGTVWGAGFPVSNVEVECKLFEPRHTVKDYLGPCVDLGFRLCTLADTRRIPLSLDVAYMIVMTQCEDGVRPPMHCEEPKTLKGLPAPYPHIWIDRTDGKPSPEDVVLDRRGSKQYNEIQRYIEHLYHTQPELYRKPFIDGDSSGTFNAIPDDMRRARETMKSELAEDTYTSVEAVPTTPVLTTPPVLPTDASLQGPA